MAAEKNMLVNITVGLNDKASRGLRDIANKSLKAKKDIGGGVSGGSSIASNALAGLNSSLLLAGGGLAALSASISKMGGKAAAPIAKVQAGFKGITNSFKGFSKPDWGSGNGGINGGLAQIRAGLSQQVTGWKQATSGLRNWIKYAKEADIAGRRLAYWQRKMPNVGRNGMSFRPSNSILRDNFAAQERASQAAAGARAGAGRGLSNMLSGFGSSLAGFGKLAGGVFSSLIGGSIKLIPYIGAIVAVLSQVAAAVGNILVKAFQVGFAIIRSVVNAVIAVVGNLISAIKIVGQTLLGVAKIAGVAGVAIGGALAYVAKSSLDAAMNMEMMNTQMETAMKSASKSKEMMAWAKDFAKTTPFEATDIVEATVKLQMMGKDAKHLLPILGNLSSAMGKPLMQGVEAYIDAISGGGLERLKEFFPTTKLTEFGANKSGNGIAQGTQKDLDAIGKAIENFSNANFAGSMAKQMKTATGAVSNFKDMISEIKIEIGNMLLPSFKAWLNYGGQLIQWAKDSGAFNRLGNIILKLGNGIMYFGALLIKIATTSNFKPIANSFRNLANNVLMAIGAISGGLVMINIPAIVNKIATAIDWLANNVFNPQKLQGAWQFFTGMVKMISNFVVGAVVLLTSYAGQITATFQWIVQWGQYLAGWFYTNMPAIIDVVAQTFSSIANWILTVMDVANPLITTLIVLGEVSTSIWFGSLSAISYVTAAIVNLIDLVTGGLIPGLGEARQWFEKLGKSSANKAFNNMFKYPKQAIGASVKTGEGINKVQDWIQKIPGKTTGLTDQMRAFGAAHPYSPQMPSTQMPIVPKGQSANNIPTNNVSNNQPNNFNITINVANGDPNTIKTAMDDYMKNNFPRYYREAQRK